MVANNKRLTLEYLEECLSYNPETGIFLWKERPRYHFSTDVGWKRANTRCKGKIAGSKCKVSGYLRVALNGKMYYLHRLAWFMYHNEQANIIDHINHNVEDNRISNLRNVNHLINNQNKVKSKANTSGFTGVSFHKFSNKWQAKIGVTGKAVFLGLYDDKEDAKAAYEAAKKQYHLS